MEFLSWGFKKHMTGFTIAWSLRIKKRCKEIPCFDRDAEDAESSNFDSLLGQGVSEARSYSDPLLKKEKVTQNGLLWVLTKVF